MIYWSGGQLWRKNFGLLSYAQYGTSNSPLHELLLLLSVCVSHVHTCYVVLSPPFLAYLYTQWNATIIHRIPPIRQALISEGQLTGTNYQLTSVPWQLTTIIGISLSKSKTRFHTCTRVIEPANEGTPSSELPRVIKALKINNMVYTIHIGEMKIQ